MTDAVVGLTQLSSSFHDDEESAPSWSSIAIEFHQGNIRDRNLKDRKDRAVVPFRFGRFIARVVNTEFIFDAYRELHES